MRHRALLFSLVFLLMPFSLLAKNQVHTEHYVVVFEDGNEFFANEAITVAEEVWDELATAYGIFEDFQKIYVYILDPGDYANGYAHANKNCVTIYTTNLNAGIRGTSNWIRNVVTHELAHVFSIKTASKNMLFNNFSIMSWSRFRNPDWSAKAQYWNFLAPSWWVEGIAQYEAYRNRNDFWDTHRDMFLRMAVLENDLLDYVEMGVYGNRNGFYEEMVYNQGYSLVLFIDSLFGQVSVRRSAQASSWLNFDGSLKKATGKSGQALYDMWKKTLMEKYSKEVSRIRNDVREGALFFDGGFWDQFPSISPDDEQCAFVSNKGFDVRYTHLYVRNKRTKIARRMLADDKTVDSRIQWFPDGKSVLYSRWNKQTAYLDIYRYYLSRNIEKQLTWHARAMDPALARDGKTIAFIENKGGIQNLVLIDSDGRNRRQLTNFANGTQLFSPCWMPDGKNIVLGIFNGADRDIAMVSSEAAPLDRSRKITDTLFFPESLNFESDLKFRLLVHSSADERDPCLSPDGRTLYFSSDRTGIFNIYRMDLVAAMARDSAAALNQEAVATHDTAMTRDTLACPDTADVQNATPLVIEAEQVTNVLGGAFHPSVDRDNARIYFTGFHAANYSIYSIQSRGFKKVTIENVERDYRKRARTPYLFASGTDDGVSRLKPYQYTLSPYKPVYTMWDISPFVTFSPAYITDSIGDAHIKGGIQFLLGELSGYANLMGFVYGGKSPKSRAGLSWGGGLLADLRLPRIMGQNRMYQPFANLFAQKDEIRDEEVLRPEPYEASRAPYQSRYLRSGTSAPDTLIAQYVDFADGSFRTSQTFEDVGITGGLRFDRYNRIDADFSRRNVSFSGSVLDASLASTLRIYTVPNPNNLRSASDITSIIRNDSDRNTRLDQFIEAYNFTLDPVTYLDEYKDFLVYRDYQAGLAYSYTNVRPAQVLPFRADLYAAHFSLAKSTYYVGTLSPANDTSYSIRDGAEPTFIYNRNMHGEPAPFLIPLLQEEDYARYEANAVERFPLFGNARHLATASAFFGTLDRKLPDVGSAYPLQYRAGMFLSAYPYSFDPVDTGTAVDSFEVPVEIGNTVVPMNLYTTKKIDTRHKDLLWGNRIMYLNAGYTLEIIRGLTFKPLGLLIQGIYATGFAEAAGIWNVDLLESSLPEFLGMGKEFDMQNLGKSYLRDAGLRLEIPFVLFENWRGFFAFSWARRLSLDDQILRIEYTERNGALYPSKIWRLDKNRFSVNLSLSN